MTAAGSGGGGRDSAASDEHAAQLNEAQRSLDDLVTRAQSYRSSKDFRDLLLFIARFRWYSPYNAMLVHVQLPGAEFVAPAGRWERNHGRIVRPGARPIMILQPQGPVMFVFDVSDTEEGADAVPLPLAVTQPFRSGTSAAVPVVHHRTVENAKRDGVRVVKAEMGGGQAGEIRHTAGTASQEFTVRRRPRVKTESVPVRYDLLVNSRLTAEAQYGSLVHELAHLYCGHLGTPDARWWPDRGRVSHDQREFEAESVAFLVRARLDGDATLPPYLVDLLDGASETPPVSLERVVKAAGDIEKMGQEHLRPRRRPDAP